MDRQIQDLWLHADYSERDPLQALTEAGRRTPYYLDEPTRTVYVLRADDVAELFADQRLWSRRPRDPRLDSVPADQRPVLEKLKAFTSAWPIFLEGEQHDRVRGELLEGLRRVVTPAFTELLDDRVATLLDRQGHRRFDWIAEFAGPLTASSIGAMLGVGQGDVDHLTPLASAIIDELATPLIDYDRACSASAAADELQSWLAGAVQAPPSPVLAALARIWAADGPLVATAALTQLVTGSLDPVLATLCALTELVTPQRLQGSDPTTLREEVIRLAAPFRFVIRYARCPLEVGPHAVAERGRVALGLATANLGAGGVAAAEVGRAGIPHFSFGQGRHYCLGATITRAVARAVIAYLAQSQVVFRPDTVRRKPELTVLRYRAVTGRLDRFS